MIYARNSAVKGRKKTTESSSKIAMAMETRLNNTHRDWYRVIWRHLSGVRQQVDPRVMVHCCPGTVILALKRIEMKKTVTARVAVHDFGFRHTLADQAF